MTGTAGRSAPAPLPLPALLSQVLVAFTIEADNELEHQLPHRTTRGPAAGSRRGPWLVSLGDLPALLSRVLLAFTIEFERELGMPLAVSANALRVLTDEGVRLADLPRLAGISQEAASVSVGFLESRGYAVAGHAPARARRGRARPGRARPGSRPAEGGPAHPEGQAAARLVPAAARRHRGTLAGAVCADGIGRLRAPWRGSWTRPGTARCAWPRDCGRTRTAGGRTSRT